MKSRLHHIRLLFFFAALTMLAACGTKKNTAVSRNWQAFNTRYNVYFNGNEHYKETLKAMEEGYEDDFTRMLLTHPADARADETMPKPKGDFKRTIEKMQKAIQLHSIKKKPAKKSGSAKEKAFRARDEFNPFLHNAWLMLGKGQYFNGDFMGAAATFMYISRHFTWLPEVVTEAMLWQARSYAALDWTYEAENILVKIKDKDLSNKSLRHLYDLVEASYLIKAG
ncbi:MAG: tetratricopeptide repeat protein, partial [Muribaculaceae bacterium]|nr:tetratricopeptide repeat protein [Muribaculaceae bacterium]